MTAAARRTTSTTSSTTRGSRARSGCTARPPCASPTSRSRRMSKARPASSASTSTPPAPTPCVSCCATPTGEVVATGTGVAGALRVAGRPPLAAGRRLPVHAHRAGARRRRGRRRVLAPGRRPHARGARHRVPDQRQAVLLHRLRPPRRQRGPRQGPRQRLPRPRLPAHGLDRRELVPHLALPVRRRGHGVRRPPRHRRHRRGRRRRTQPRDGRRHLRRAGAADLLARDHQRPHPRDARAGDPRADRPRQEPPQRRDVVDHERARIQRRGRSRVLRAARRPSPASSIPPDPSPSST